MDSRTMDTGVRPVRRLPGEGLGPAGMMGLLKGAAPLSTAAVGLPACCGSSAQSIERITGQRFQTHIRGL